MLRSKRLIYLFVLALVLTIVCAAVVSADNPNAPLQEVRVETLTAEHNLVSYFRSRSVLVTASAGIRDTKLEMSS